LGIGATAPRGYILNGVEDNNLDSTKIAQVFWTGVRYAYDSKTAIVLSYYRLEENTFRVPPTCTATNMQASCGGYLNEGSPFVDHHFTKRFDAYAGITYSKVSGGLAIAIPHGPGVPYYHDDNVAPVIGVRFTF
jgi:predicted porin